MSKSDHATNASTRTPAAAGRGELTRRAVLKSAGAGGLALGAGLFSSNLFSIKGAARRDLTVGLFAEPAGLNEFLRTGIQGGWVVTNVYDKLSVMNPDTRKVEGELATGWKAESPTTWVIKLREGVKWHKGYGELTAEDVAWTFNYIIEKKTFQIGSGLAGVLGAKVRNKYTVEVQIAKPFTAFPAVTMDYGGHIMSKKAHEEMGPKEYSRNPINVGAYVFDSWVSGSHIVIKKNKDYWRKGEPLLDEIVFRFIPDPSVRSDSLVKGEVDLIGHPDPIDVPQFKSGKVKGITYNSVPGWNWDYMAFTLPPLMKDPNFPTLKKEVRQAISYAIDREVLVNEIYAGEAVPSDSPIPPGYIGHRPVPIHYPKNADLAKARELMKKAGVSGFDLEIITSDKDWLRREVELTAAMLSQIGINVKVQGLDIGTWTERWKTSRKFQALLEDITIVSPDPDSTVYHFHHTKTGNHFGWIHPGVDEWLDDARKESDPDKRAQLYYKVVDAIHEDNPYIYLSHVNNVFLYKNGLKNFKPSPQDNVLYLQRVEWA
jgi:peptide/nickel transport system substrate-binding protein